MYVVERKAGNVLGPRYTEVQIFEQIPLVPWLAGQGHIQIKRPSAIEPGFVELNNYGIAVILEKAPVNGWESVMIEKPKEMPLPMYFPPPPKPDLRADARRMWIDAYLLMIRNGYKRDRSIMEANDAVVDFIERFQ